MADEPTNGELSRLIGLLDTRFQNGLGDINARLDKVVSLDVYTIQTSYLEQRLAALHSDGQRNADATKKLEDEFEKYQRDQAIKREDERQKRLYQAVIPVLICLVGAAISLWSVISK